MAVSVYTMGGRYLAAARCTIAAIRYARATNPLRYDYVVDSTRGKVNLPSGIYRFTTKFKCVGAFAQINH